MSSERPIGHNAEVSILSLSELNQIDSSITRQEGENYERARLKTVAELCCITYQLTKLPFMEEGKEGEGQERLRLLLTAAVSSCTEAEISEMVELRTRLYEETLANRSTGVGVVRLTQQNAEWVWSKVIGEEVGELAFEANSLLVSTGLVLPLVEGIVSIQNLVAVGERNTRLWLREIFGLARTLGVRSEFGLFKFMTEKQRRRNAMGKTEDEWEVLLPVAKEYFS